MLVAKDIEVTGIVEECAANRAKYARFAYVAPQDRHNAPKPVALVAVPAKRKAIAIKPDDTIRRKSLAVMETFCEVYNEIALKDFTPDTLRMPLRNRDVSWARHVCILLVRKICGLSTTQIGKIFERDHSSVIYALEHAENHMAEIKNLRETHERVRAFFSQSADAANNTKRAA